MDKKIARKWAEDLRSGKFIQAKGTLVVRTGSKVRTKAHRDGMCCLGVLSCRIKNLKAVKATGWRFSITEGDHAGVWAHPGRPFGNIYGSLPSAVRGAIGLGDGDEHNFTAANDQFDKSFKQIARMVEQKYLREYPSVVVW